MKFLRWRSRWADWRYQWRTAGRYGYRGDLLRGTLEGPWERFWLCRVRDEHHVKMATAPRCYRCGRTP